MVKILKGLNMSRGKVQPKRNPLFPQKMELSGLPSQNPEDFNLSITETGSNSMMKKLEDCGILRDKAVEIMKERRENFIEACMNFLT